MIEKDERKKTKNEITRSREKEIKRRSQRERHKAKKIDVER